MSSRIIRNARSAPGVSCTPQRCAGPPPLICDTILAVFSSNGVGVLHLEVATQVILLRYLVVVLIVLPGVVTLREIFFVNSCILGKDSVVDAVTGQASILLCYNY